MKTTYTIDRLSIFEIYGDTDVVAYIKEVAPIISERFGNKFNYKNIDMVDMVENKIFLICRRNEKITGHLICFLTYNSLDPEVKILRQLAFYAKPDSGRTAYHLFQKFIDIGKKQANHIITNLTSQTNIKSSTLENYGFKELETLYRMEIK